MPTYPPFTRPLVPGTSRCAWRQPGVPLAAKPPFLQSPYVVTGRLLELLEAADLPESELRHMGATAALLGFRPALLTPVEDAVALLGRIVWDARYGAQGDAYVDAIDASQSLAMGQTVVHEWFAA